jgi:Putative beta-barrel porin-2, OmpL-like. bbp2
MKKKLISLAIAGAVATPFAAQAGSLKVANQDITLSGGITGAYLYNSDVKRDNYVVDDALLDLSTAAKAGGMGFDLGIGTLGGNNLASSGSPLNVIGNGANVGVQYGWVSLMPVDGLKVDAGLLATNVGYEVFPSYGNDNILRGLVWNNQPAYYTGARVTYSMDSFSVYAEGNKDNFALNPFYDKPTGTGSAIGASATMGPVNGSLSLFSVANEKSIVDIIVSGKAGPVKLAANIDYQTKSKAFKNWETNNVNGGVATDDNAYGVALYASMPLGDKVALPLRVEYVNDGTSGLYGLGGLGASNTALTFTITPTYNFSDSTFVRGELAYVSTDKKTAYVDDKGALTDSNLIVGAQAGVRF